MHAFHRRLACVHEQKAARAVGVFRIAGCKAALTEQRRLLVASNARDRHLHALNVARAVDLGRIAHRRQHRGWNPELPQKPFVPAEFVDIIEHRARGVCVVGDMYLPVRELPDEPGIDRAEQELSPLGLFPRAGDMIQNPFDLRAGKIRVQHQTRRLFDIVPEPAPLQLVADGGRAPALPDDGVVDGLSRRFVPDDGRLALVRNADGGNVPRVDVRLRDDLHHDPVDAGVDLHRVVLHPAGLGVILGKFLLRDRDDVLHLVKQNRAAAGRALIEGEKITRHGVSPFINFGLRCCPDLKAF